MIPLRLRSIVLVSALLVGATATGATPQAIAAVASASGMVLDQMGRPLVGAKVELSRGATVVAQTVSDGTGDWTTAVPDGDTYDVAVTFAEADGRASRARLNGALTSGRPLTTVVLRPATAAVTLTGTLRSARTGQPLTGVAIGLAHGPTESALASAVTDANGKFILEAPAERYDLSFSLVHPKMPTATVRVVAPNVDVTQSARLDLVVPFVDVVVDVRDEANRPLAGAGVSVGPKGAAAENLDFELAPGLGAYADAFTDSGFTDASGRAVLTGLPEGALAVTVNAADEGLSVATATVDARSSTQVRMEVRRPVTVSGVVRDHRGPRADGSVTLTSETTSASGSVGPDGRYEAKVPPGRYRLEASAGPEPDRAYVTVTVADFDVTGDRHQDITFPTIDVAASVSAAGPPGETQVVGLSSWSTQDRWDDVRTIPVEVFPGGWGMGGFGSQGAVGGDGVAHLQALPTATARMATTFAGSGDHRTDKAQVVTDGTVLRIEPRPTARVHGIVREPQGRPLQGVSVFFSARHALSGSDGQTTGPDGGYDVDVVPGAYELIVQSSAVGTSSFRAPIAVSDDRTLDLAVPGAGTATLRRYQPDGALVVGSGVPALALAKGSVPVELAPGVGARVDAPFSATTGADGTVTLADVRSFTDLDFVIRLGEGQPEQRATRVPLSAGVDVAFASAVLLPSGGGTDQRLRPATDIRLANDGRSAAVSWAPPSGGPVPDGYEVTLRGEGQPTRSIRAAGGTRSVRFDGLTPGATYRATVTARLAGEAGPPSGTSAPLPLVVPPNAPDGLSGRVDGQTATLTWRHPLDDGGTWMAGQELVVRQPGRPDAVLDITYNYNVSTATIALTPDVSTTVTVRGRNPAGVGPESNPVVLTPGPPAPGGAAAGRSGYWTVAADGSVYAFGDAPWSGNAPPAPGRVAVDLEPTPTNRGYWIVDDQGHVQARGDARPFGDATGLRAGERVSSLSATPNGTGYWLFTTLGRVMAFGDAPFLGDLAAVTLNGPVLDSIATPTGKGYYMVASDGGIFAFGDATFRGSMGGTKLNAPVQSLVPTPDGAGYWLVASDGGVFAFAAPFRGSLGGIRLNRPVTGMVSYGNGYLMVGEDGGVFTFSDRPFAGSLGAKPPPTPMVSVASIG